MDLLTKISELTSKGYTIEFKEGINNTLQVSVSYIDPTLNQKHTDTFQMHKEALHDGYILIRALDIQEERIRMSKVKP